ncbi:hypothetical protein [Terasakiella pusilla]|jgi:hypothetical protein|uniref:hypothetical protein n=1 Tax=Terasakiella pusilla TaxID=64973 RepID=UPI00048C99D2|nr:hypothetical protein [Terasakiella pusilla]
MKFLPLSALLGAAVLVSACQTTVSSPSVKVKSPSGVEIEVKDSDKSGDGKFCPPGQAKKGNC